MALPKPPQIIANLQKTFDTELELHRSCSVATDGVAMHIAGTAATIDLGGGYSEGYFVINVTVIAKPSEGAWYDLRLQGALDSAFASAVTLAKIVLGDSTLPNNELVGPDKVTLGTYFASFNNQYGSEIMRYVRGYVHAGGTPSTGITFSAFLAKRAA